MILAKNLPAKTTEAEMIQMFAKFGELGRVVLPPSGITGIICFNILYAIAWYIFLTILRNFRCLFQE